MQRSSNQTKVTEEKEKRPATANTNKVKWRDDFETYDNDSKYIRNDSPYYKINYHDKHIRNRKTKQFHRSIYRFIESY